MQSPLISKRTKDKRQEISMGIHSEFKFGIKLYNFSFAFSNLKLKEIEVAKVKRIINLNHNFIGSFTKEMFYDKAYI